MSVIYELEKFYINFNGEKGIFGKSHFNKNLYYFKVSKTPKPVVIAQYSIHAREYITSHLAMEQIKEYTASGKVGTVYFLPMVNPDGVEICLTENPLYKSNGRGVDLNVNFPARWGTGATNSVYSGSENGIGEYPLSEMESKSLCDFTLKIKPNATLSYHSKGEEIYFEFFQKGVRFLRDFSLAKTLADYTGYALKSTPNSSGGYKDWCIQTLKIPAFTIEVGSDNLVHPIGKENLGEILEKNRKVINILTENL